MDSLYQVCTRCMYVYMYDMYVNIAYSCACLVQPSVGTAQEHQVLKYSINYMTLKLSSPEIEKTESRKTRGS